MNRPLTYLLGPETVLAVSTALLFWFCARHNSGEGRDVVILEKLIWAIPFILTPIAFATILVPGSKTWWWLGRAIVFGYLANFVCTYRLISGFGSGSKGQDAAMILAVVLASVAIAIASSTTGAMILAATKPGFATWFQAHRWLGLLLTVLSMIPMGFLLGIVVTVISTFLLAMYVEVFQR